MKVPVCSGFLLAVVWGTSCCAAPAAQSGSGGDALAEDPRLSQTLRLEKSKPIPLAAVFSQLAQVLKVDAVVAHESLAEPFTSTVNDPVARDVLRELEERFEGRWERQGDLYVLAPPPELEEVAALTPLQLTDYEAIRWQKLLKGLRSSERKSFETHKRLDYGELGKDAQKLLVEIAQARYWRERLRGSYRRIRYSWVKERRIRLVPAVGVNAEQGQTVALYVYAKPGEIPPGTNPIIVRE